MMMTKMLLLLQLLLLTLIKITGGNYPFGPGAKLKICCICPDFLYPRNKIKGNKKFTTKKQA